MALPPGVEISRGETEEFLLQAFRSFAEAADSLERSYGMLRSEVARLRAELEQSNAGLAKSLEENRQMREHLDRILDGLPCGVLVAKADGAISLVNPEGRRLLASSQKSSNLLSSDQKSSHPTAESGKSLASLSSVPGEVRRLFERARSEAGEQEQCLADGQGGERWLAVRHAAVEDAEGLHPARCERRQATGGGAGQAAAGAGAGGDVGHPGP